MAFYKVWFKHSGMSEADVKESNSKVVRLTKSEIKQKIGSEKIIELKIHGNLPSDIQEWASDVTHLQIKRVATKASLKNLSKLTMVTKLKISDNNFGTLPDEVSSLASLTELILSTNNMEDLPNSLGRLKNLTKLDISHQQFTEVPSVIEDLTTLTELIMVDCGLSTLPENLKSLSRLQKLDVSDNPLCVVPQVIPSLRSVTVLGISGCQIEVFSPSLTTLPELVTLDLSDNCFTKLPATFNDLKKLVSIDLRGNQSLTSLTASIRSMETLNEIRVGGCESLTSPPYQDCKNGVQAIKEYYESLDQGKIIELPMATVIVVGETRAGKSRLIKHLREPSIAFDLDQTTRAFEVTELQFQKPLPILEFGGGKTYQFAHRLMQKENCLPVVVVSMKEFEDRYTVQGISAKKVVQALIFNWINHFYFPYSGLNSPKLVLTHKDAFSDDPQKFFELKSILLQACNSVIKDINKFEEGKYEPNEISDKKDLFDFFGERDVFEIGAHHTDIEIIIRLRDDLYQTATGTRGQ
ncbi:MFHAS1 [Bugula neritina]|uniref:MFHAS1 n=1 Tax=Bugula neritina TaxID=10212 RepID=A0A7J7KTA9_BUGNE|nr:MFHAS1 [Bugula neritina]